MALGFVFGAWWLQQQAVLPSLQAALVLVPSLLILYATTRFAFPVRKIAIFLFAALFGFFWAATFATIRLSDELPKDWEQKSIDIIGVVATLPEVTERGERFQFDVEQVLTTDAQSGARVPEHISLNYYREVESEKPENAPSLTSYTYNSFFRAGERWQFTVRLKRPHTTYNPHGFDFEAWALTENIRATGTIRNKSGYKKLNDFVWRPRYLVEQAREKIGNRITQALVNQPYVGVIRALVVGDDSQISQADWNVFLRTGVNHLMSISGLHITMLAGLAFAIAAFVWRRFSTLVMRMPTRKAATLFGLFIAVLYALLAGMSVPTQRTLFMLITFALALLFCRNLAISRALAIALMVVVLLDPWAVIAPGFWLSFSAVALIAYVSVGRLAAQHWLKEAVNTQWTITLGLLPLLIIMFGQVSIVSPLANAFAIPVISLLVVPLAILGGLLSVDFILHAAHFILEVCMQGLNWLAGLPIATWQQAAPPVWGLISAILGVCWLLLPRGFPQRWLGLALLLPLFLVKPTRPVEGEMRVAVLDVGQGLAIVVQTKNHTLLYDAGPRYSAQSDAGSRIIIPFLRGEGVKKLDGFIVSHNDVDHSGGAGSVLMQLPVTWLASSFYLSEGDKSSKRMKCFAGQHWRWDGVDFEVLSPSWDSYEDDNLTDNNRSCVVKISSRFGSLLVTGDIEKEAESALLRGAIHESIGHAVSGRPDLNENMLKSDVLIVPHHGSKTSSTPGFLTAVAAKHAIFTVGYLNRFKHPKTLITERYEESGALIHRSDYHGALQIDFARDYPIEIKALRETQPKYWHDSY